MASSIAQTEPFPLVPPTMMMGKAGLRSSASLTRCTLSNPSAIALGCWLSMYASHSESVRCVEPISKTQISSSRRRGLFQHHGKQRRELVAHLPAVHDHVD